MILNRTLTNFFVKQAYVPDTDQGPYTTEQVSYPGSYGRFYGNGVPNVGTPTGPSVHTSSREDMGMLDQLGNYMPWKWNEGPIMLTGRETDNANRFKDWAAKERIATNTKPGGAGPNGVPIGHLLQQAISRGDVLPFNPAMLGHTVQPSPPPAVAGSTAPAAAPRSQAARSQANRQLPPPAPRPSRPMRRPVVTSPSARDAGRGLLGQPKALRSTKARLGDNADLLNQFRRDIAPDITNNVTMHKKPQ